MSDLDLFYKMSKENPYTFKKWSFVTVQVVAIKNKNVLCKVLDNGLMGIIYNYANPDKMLPGMPPRRDFHLDQVLKARVYEIYKDTRQLNLTVK